MGWKIVEGESCRKRMEDEGWPMMETGLGIRSEEEINLWWVERHLRMRNMDTLRRRGLVGCAYIGSSMIPTNLPFGLSHSPCSDQES